MDFRLLLKALIIIILVSILLYIENTYGDVTSSGATTNTQTNQSGGNTAITGGYESSTTYQSGSSSNTTNTTNNSTNQETAVNPSNAPSMSVYGQDSCVVPLAAGVTVIGFSGSFGSYFRDEECERRKKSKLLKQLGMSVASISIMCQDYDVWYSMKMSGTSCPIDGLIGKAAEQRWEEVGGFYRKKEKVINGKPSMTWNHQLENE